MNPANSSAAWVWRAFRGTMLILAGASVAADINRRFLSPGGITAPRHFIQTDRTLADAGGDGPIGLQFVNCGGAGREFVYFRAVYVLFPKRVVIVNPDNVVFDAQSIPDGIVHPASWWRRNGVKAVLTFDGNTQSWETGRVLPG